MLPAWLFLVALIGMAPAVLTLDGPLTLGVEFALLAIALVIAAKGLKPNEVAQLRILIPGIAIWAAVPPILMAFQAVPLPITSRLSNSIWQSASTALGQPLMGSISIDTGSTLLSLCRYFAWLGVFLLTCTIAVDRQRAEKVLFATTAATAVIALLLITNDALGLAWLDKQHDPLGRGGALDAAVLGIILSATCAVRAYERFETRKADDDRSVHRLASNVLTSCVAFAVCAAAIALGDAGNTLFAAAAGLVTLLGIVFVRRLELGRWGGLAVALGGCVLGVWIVGATMREGRSDFTVRFAAPPSPSNAITERMLTDSRWIGTGVGTYHALVPIYREPNDAMSDVEPPTAAAQTAVEWGRPLLWAGAVAAVVLVGMLLRAGMSRGRDSFYAAAGASSVAALLISAFGNPGLFGTSVLIIVGTVLGLAVAQSRSRAAQ
ncbi:MAG: hypothetical protein WB760_09630 [Xanthobacteraceae bacterium]